MFLPCLLNRSFGWGKQLYELAVGDPPSGFAIGREGLLYVTCDGNIGASHLASDVERGVGHGRNCGGPWTVREPVNPEPSAGS